MKLDVPEIHSHFGKALEYYEPTHSGNESLCLNVADMMILFNVVPVNFAHVQLHNTGSE